MSQATTLPDVEQFDGMNHYGVTISVKDAAPDKIIIKLWKDNSTRDIQDTKLYKTDNGEWRCILHNNYAVVDKALGMLNDN